MKQGDTVGDFRDRLIILLMDVENVLKEDKGASYTNDMMPPMKEATIDIFIKGLSGNISAAVDTSHPTDLESAYKEAVKIEARIRSRILPDSRQSEQLGHYAEQNELSQNLRSRARFYPNCIPGTITRNQAHETAPSPAFVGYFEMDASADDNLEETALTYPDADPPFVGYVASDATTP